MSLFLRNDAGGCRFDGLENKAECLGAPMQIVDHPRAVTGLVEGRAGVDVLHPGTQGVVEQDCNLARRGVVRLRLADARREPPVESTQRRVGPSNGYGSKPEERRSSVPATACWGRERLAARDLVARCQA